MMPELEIKGQVYRASAMDTFVQFHVARRLGPLLMEFTSALAEAPKGLAIDKWIGHVFGPVMGVISRMTDEDVNYVIHACLGVVQRKEGERWASVQKGSQLMYGDITMDSMIKLTIFVVREVLGPFLPEVLAATGSGSSSPVDRAPT